MNAIFDALPPLDFAQGLGFLSFVLGILCFYQKDDRKLKIVMILMSINNVIHFGLLGAIAACVASGLAAFRTALSLNTSSPRIAYGFITISVTLGVYIADSALDMLPIVGTCIGTYALFFLSGIKLRIGLLCGTTFWLANNIIVGSMGTTLLEFTLLIVNLSTILRMYYAKQKQ